MALSVELDRFDETKSDVQYLTAIELEGPMMERTQEMEERVGVYFLHEVIASNCSR